MAALRAQLLFGTGAAAGPDPAATVEVLARWRPSWLRYSPLSWSGLAMLAAGWAVLAQTGVGAELGRWVVTRSGAAAAVTAIALAAVTLAVIRSLLTFGNLVLTRTGTNLDLTHGLARVREHTYDLSRFRGATGGRAVCARL